MNIKNFDYDLPKELIAQKPAEKREDARLLVLSTSQKRIEHKQFINIDEYLNNGDILVVNDTKVIPARLKGYVRGSDHKVEVLLVSCKSGNLWDVLIFPGKKVKPGDTVCFGEKLKAEVKEITPGGRLVEFVFDGDFREIIEELGEPPLPHYIKREKGATDLDRSRYQTVYADREGAIAAPTAGFHFSNEILDRITKKGIEILKITLHVGLGSFKPVRSESILEHKMQQEYYEINEKVFSVISGARRQKRRLVAVGTTSVRAIESALSLENFSGSGMSELFIYPGFKFRAVDAMVTNFHMPCSTPLILVCAFAGQDLLFESYRQAIEQKYRFLSFGDAMLIFNK